MFVLLFTLPTGGVSAQGADNSSYNGVETYPYDNNMLTLGQSFTKGWELKNSGTTTWDTANYTFELIEGSPAMGSTIVSLPKNVAPGETVLINVPMVAPLTAGLYKNRYQLKHNGVPFGSRPYVLIQVGNQLVPTPANANQLQPTAAANPNTITYITQSGISVVGTVAPNGVYVVNQANGGPAQRSRIEQQCKTTGIWWWAKTECSNVAITIDLPATPVNEEPKSLNGTQGTLYSFAAGFGVMTMSYPTYVSSAASSTLPSAINSAAIAAGASAAAPYVLVGILVCGPLILMYFSPATTYNGPSPISSTSAGNYEIDTTRFTNSIESLSTTALTSAQWSTDIDTVFSPRYLESTKHAESAGVIAAIYSMAQGKNLKSRGDKCNYNCNGSIQLWGGINTDGTGSVAILYIASTKVAFLVLKGTLYSATNGAIISDSMIKLGNGQYIDPTQSIWAAAFILGKGLGKSYDPMKALDVGEGMAAWQYKQAQYKLYIPLTQITLP